MRICVWALLVLVVALPVSGQETRGNISGTVRDATKAVIPGASVKITNTDTGASQDLVTNESGYFEAPLLQPGNYEISVELPGFKRVTQRGIVLGVGQQMNIPFTLEVGQTSEELTVTAEAPLLGHNSRVVRPDTRQAFDRRSADDLEHADHADSLLGRRKPVHNTEPGVPGLR
jgi:uncharacterized surface anchored protein